MKVIYKYVLTVVDRQTLTLPRSAQPLGVQYQGGALCFWAQVDLNDTDPFTYEILIVGTGRHVDIKDTYFYISTVQNSGLVWHIFGGEKA